MGPTWYTNLTNNILYFFTTTIHHPTLPFTWFQNPDFKSNVDSKKKKKHSIIYQNHSPKSTPLDASRENESVEEVSGPLCVDVLYTAPGMNGNAKAIYLQWRHQDLKSGGARRGQRLIMGGQTCARSAHSEREAGGRFFWITGVRFFLGKHVRGANIASA